MAEPPLAGAVQLTVACASPAVAVGAAGVAGAVAAGPVAAVVPVPVSGTLTISPLESVTRRLAVLPPVVVGLNTTPISQPPSGATGVPVQVLFGPSAKCA